ncbi:Ubiquitin-conjugating enzyme E2-18 kDa [Fusarium oxysporum f. sp. albedinis]|nr:Ubiquitin-conjugating enzyme E2-18 kDa [Fusarium oxysporum f. sp. albedinis]
MHSAATIVAFPDCNQSHVHHAESLCGLLTRLGTFLCLRCQFNCRALIRRPSDTPIPARSTFFPQRLLRLILGNLVPKSTPLSSDPG